MNKHKEFHDVISVQGHKFNQKSLNTSCKGDDQKLNESEYYNQTIIFNVQLPLLIDNSNNSTR